MECSRISKFGKILEDIMKRGKIWQEIERKGLWEERTGNYFFSLYKNRNYIREENGYSLASKISE
jgi:hypothetical protein